MKQQRTKNRIFLANGELNSCAPTKIEALLRNTSIGYVPDGFLTFRTPAVASRRCRVRPSGRILVVIRYGRTRERIAEVVRHFVHQSRTEIHVIDPVSADVAGEVRRAAISVKADWLCMVAHGGTGLMALFLDPEDERILRAAPCPVVCFSEALRPERGAELAGSLLPIRRILVPVNSSANSQDLLARAVALAKQFGAKIDLLGVEELRRKPFYSAGASFSAERKMRRRELLNELEKLRQQSVPKRQRGRKIVSLGLPLFYSTNRVARELQSDLVVLLTPNRRWDTNGRIDIGTERILRGATCPVICIPEREFRADTALHQRVSETWLHKAETRLALEKPEARGGFPPVNTNNTNMYEHYESEITYSRR